MPVQGLPVPPTSPGLLMGAGGGGDTSAPSSPGTMGSMLDPGAAIGDVQGLAQMLGQAQKPEDQIMEKLRPAVSMIYQLADYMSNSPELMPFVQSFMQIIFGKGRGQGVGSKGQGRMTASGLTSPASQVPPLASGPGPTMPGMPRPPAM